MLQGVCTGHIGRENTKRCPAVKYRASGFPAKHALKPVAGYKIGGLVKASLRIGGGLHNSLNNQPEHRSNFTFTSSDLQACRRREHGHRQAAATKGNSSPPSFPKPFQLVFTNCKALYVLAQLSRKTLYHSHTSRYQASLLNSLLLSSRFNYQTQLSKRSFVKVFFSCETQEFFCALHSKSAQTSSLSQLISTQTKTPTPSRPYLVVDLLNLNITFTSIYTLPPLSCCTSAKASIFLSFQSIYIRLPVFET